MAGWFAKKSQNARVNMVAKELKWKFEMWSPWRIAKTRLLGNRILVELSTANAEMVEFFDNPFAFSRDYAMQVYEALETSRNHAHFQLEATKKGLARFGITMPQISIDHVEDSNRGLELWMLIPGMVVDSEKAENAVSIWATTAACRSALPDALKQIREVEKVTSEMTGVENFLAPMLTNAENIFDLAPAIIKKRLGKA